MALKHSVNVHKSGPRAPEVRRTIGLEPDDPFRGRSRSNFEDGGSLDVRLVRVDHARSVVSHLTSFMGHTEAQVERRRRRRRRPPRNVDES